MASDLASDLPSNVNIHQVQTIIASIAVALLLSLYQLGVRNPQATAITSNYEQTVIITSNAAALGQDGTECGVDLETATGQDACPEKAVEQLCIIWEAGEGGASDGEAGKELEAKQSVTNRYSWE